MDLKKEYLIKQNYQPSDKKSGYFNWSIWLEDGSKSIQDIEEVEYLLHSSFPEPLRILKDPADNFKLTSAGWGEFSIRILIREKDGNVLKVSHWLDLSSSSPDGPAPSRGIDNAGEDEALRKVFLSFDASQTQMAMEVAKQLYDIGLEVRTGANSEPGKSAKENIEGAIESSDAMIVIKSDRSSKWQELEEQFALDKNIQIIPLEDLNLPGVEFYQDYTSKIKGLADKLRKYK